MRVRVLGCSGGIGAGLRTTAILIDDSILIDAGTGVGDLPLDEIRCIQHVFLTHSHMDHIAGLPLFLDTAFAGQRDGPIRIHGCEQTLEALRTHVFNWTIWPDFAVLPSAEHPTMRYEPLIPGEAVSVADYRLMPVPVEHSVPAVGYCVERGGRVFAFSGDTRTNRSLWPVLNSYDRVDVLVIEVSFPNRESELAERAGHYCPESLARDIGRLTQEPQIWITAMKPGEEALIFEEVRQAMPNLAVRCLQSGDIIHV